MARVLPNIDIMLEVNPGLCPPLDKRDPERSLFLLLTPRVFKGNPTSRLYGFKFNEYRSEPLMLRLEGLGSGLFSWHACIIALRFNYGKGLGSNLD